jgi:hypothetical protein
VSGSDSLTIPAIAIAGIELIGIAVSLRASVAKLAQGV